MLERLYVHNFRCLENFDLVLGSRPSTLLVGRNGTGKTTVSHALEILQSLGRGTARVRDLVRPNDLTRSRTDTPLRFEIEAKLKSKVYKYAVAFDFPSGFRELRVFREELLVDGIPAFTRELAQIRLMRTGAVQEVAFRMDWHSVALPIVESPVPASDDPIAIFRQWLGNLLILRPIPQYSLGRSEVGTTSPDPDMHNLGEWFTGLFAHVPEAYGELAEFLKNVMPDMQGIRNISAGGNHKQLTMLFAVENGTFSVPFEDLSDGEKCFVICGLVIAANQASMPFLCFWDEPDNFVGPAEVADMMMALRQSFQTHGQLIVTSHSTQAISQFSEDNTIVFYRNSHLEPTQMRSVEDLRARGQFSGSLIDAIVRGDATP